MASQKITKFHPNFNRKVVPVVFSVDGIGFKIDAAILTAHSAFFRNMLDSEELGLEGEGSEEIPIVVPGTTQESFANFCGWLNHNALEPITVDEHQLLDILHVSHLYEVKTGIDFAVAGLSKLNLTPCLRLKLARRYHIDSWIDGVVRDLLSKSVDSYGNDDIDIIGRETFFFIISAREKIAVCRKKVANFPVLPKVSDGEQAHAPSCTSHTVCERVWVERWFSHLGRKINSTSAPIPLSTAASVLKATNHPKLNPECKAYLIELVQQRPALKKEEELIQEVVDWVRST